MERHEPRRDALDRGTDEDARAIGINPLRSGVKVEDEGLYPIQHRYWLTALQRAVGTESKAQSQ